MATRDDFTEPTKRVLAQRVAYYCSNPTCRRLTVGPHSQPDKPLVTGIACHINAAAEGGPRFDPLQTPEQRRHASNGIWLCPICSKRVDTDWAAWPRERLAEMKDSTESWVSQQGMVPRLPEITLETLKGLRTAPGWMEIVAEDIALYREQDFAVLNPNRVELHNLRLRLCLPEAIVGGGREQKNAGTIIQIDSDSPEPTINIRGGGKVSCTPRPPNSIQLQIQKLSAGEVVKLPFYTASNLQFLAIDSAGNRIDVSDPDSFLGDSIHFFIEGTFQYYLHGEYLTSTLFVPLQYSFRRRAVASLPVCDSREPFTVIETVLSMGGIKLTAGAGPGGGNLD